MVDGRCENRSNGLVAMSMGQAIELEKATGEANAVMGVGWLNAVVLAPVCLKATDESGERTRVGVSCRTEGAQEGEKGDER